MKNLDKKYQKEIKSFYNKNGWVKIKNFLSIKSALTKKKTILDFLRKEHTKYKGRDINYLSNKKIHSNITSFHSLKNIKKIDYQKTNKDTKSIAEYLLGTKVRLRSCEVFLKPPRSTHKTPAHQDAAFWNIRGNKGLTFWIALTKCEKKNGSLYYLNGSHKKGVVSHKKSFVKGTSQKIKSKKFFKNYQKIATSCLPGDLLVHDCKVAHGSFKNSSSTKRIGWTLSFIDKYGKINSKKSISYEKSLSEQINIK
ncbi:phytanoyl-CoA dioxygenase family protein [Pelagibacteraceae bacterium]|nr:phytanoyl-CoA dioxygenase family protein [Pelagibacteraceae bacterium]